MTAIYHRYEIMKWNAYKIIPWLVGILILLWLYITFYSVHGYEEMLIPAGTDHFVASFDRISNIVPVDENVEDDALIETEPVSMTILFTDEQDGSTDQVDLRDSHIHVNGYADVDSIHTEDLPLELVEGHTYSVQYWAVCDGQQIDGLSLALYGDETSFLWLQVTLLLLALIGAVCLWRIWKSSKYTIAAMLVLWSVLYCMYLLSMPLQLREDEERAFARAYAVSNGMMGMEPVDENGYVYMEDAGLRNSGYLVYDVPYYRFWSNIGTPRDAGIATSVIYKDDGARTLRTYVDATAITAARSLGCSWPVVYLSGALMTGVIALIILGILLVHGKKESIRIRLLSVALLPSLMTALQLHSGFAGLLRPLDADYSWLRLDESIRRVILYLNVSDGNQYFITYAPIIVIGVFLWNDLHKKTMPVQRERTLLAGMVVAVVAAALLRLQI